MLARAALAADLHEGEAELGEGVGERPGGVAEAVAEAVDERGHAVDRERGLTERLGSLGAQAEVEHRELVEADRVIGEDRGDRRRRELGQGLPDLLLVELGAGLVDVALRCPRPRRRAGFGLVPGLVFAAGGPDAAHAAILTGTT